MLCTFNMPVCIHIHHLSSIIYHLSARTHTVSSVRTRSDKLKTLPTRRMGTHDWSNALAVTG